MNWVNMMAAVQSSGLPVDVGAMMEDFIVQSGGASSSSTAASSFGTGNNLAELGL
jgi:hypothetical protein